MEEEKDSLFEEKLKQIKDDKGNIELEDFLKLVKEDLQEKMIDLTRNLQEH